MSEAISLVVYPRFTNMTIVITNIFQNLSTEHVLANITSIKTSTQPFTLFGGTRGGSCVPRTYPAFSNQMH